MTVQHNQKNRRLKTLALATALIAPAVTSCAVTPDDDTTEPSGDIAVVASVGRDGKVSVSSQPLTAAAAQEQTEVWSEVARYLEEARDGKAAWGPGALEQWIDAKGSTKLRNYANKALGKDGRGAGSTGVSEQALTASGAIVNDWNTCFIYAADGMLDLAIWTGTNYTGSFACFLHDSTVHLHLPTFVSGTFHRNIRSIQTFNHGVQTMTDSGLHYGGLAPTIANPYASIDYRLDPYLHGNL